MCQSLNRGSKSPLSNLQLNGLRSTKMPTEHIWKHISWLWCEVMPWTMDGQLTLWAKLTTASTICTVVKRSDHQGVCWSRGLVCLSVCTRPTIIAELEKNIRKLHEKPSAGNDAECNRKIGRPRDTAIWKQTSKKRNTGWRQLERLAQDRNAFLESYWWPMSQEGRRILWLAHFSI